MAGVAERARLIAELELKDNFSKGIGSATASLGRLESSLGRMGRGAGQVGAGLARIGTIAATAAAGGLAAVVTTAASFEQAFTGVEKTVDGTEAQLAELEATVRQMARTIPVSFEELSAIGEAGGALGVARDSLDEFIDVVARLSVSTNLSSDQAATALGQLGTILHLSGQDFEDFADSLVALGNAGASTEDQIVDLAARFASAGNSAGLTKEEILALASATASMGIEVEAGGTALSQTFNNIATGIGTGSNEIKAFTDLLGISAAEFKKRWTEDALGTFQDFLTELGKLDQFEQADVLTKAGITGVRQLNAVKLMTQNIGFLSDQLEVSQNATGALDKESQKFFDTTQGQWIILKNNVRDAAATIGTELLPVTNELIKEFVGFLSAPGTQAGLKDFAADLAAGVRGLITELKGTDFSGIIEGMKLAAEVAKGAFNAFRALPEPIQQLAIAALVANKVSGGAVGQIAKGLGNIVLGTGGLFSRGSSPANPMWVAQVGGAPGVGAPVAGVGGVIKSLLGVTTAVGLGAILGNAIGKHFFFDPEVKPTVEWEQSQFDQFIQSNDPKVLQGGLDSIDAALADLNESLPGGLVQLLAGDQLAELERQGSLTRAKLDAVSSSVKAGLGGLTPPLTGIKFVDEQIRSLMISVVEQERSTRANTAESARWAGLAQAELRNISAKPFTSNVSVAVNAVSNISVSNVSGALTSYRIAGSGTIGGFTESAF